MGYFDTSLYYCERNDSYLMHHGIKGQKWGVRRYQNPDGTLTEAGKARYGEGYELTNADKRQLRKEASSEKTIAKNEAKAYKIAQKNEITRKVNESKQKIADAENEAKQLQKQSKKSSKNTNEVEKTAEELAAEKKRKTTRVVAGALATGLTLAVISNTKKAQVQESNLKNQFSTMSEADRKKAMAEYKAEADYIKAAKSSTNIGKSEVGRMFYGTGQEIGKTLVSGLVKYSLYAAVSGEANAKEAAVNMFNIKTLNSGNNNNGGNNNRKNK